MMIQGYTRNHGTFSSWESKVPPQSYVSPINSRPYDQGLKQPLVSLNKAGEKRAGYFLGRGSFGGGTLDSHDFCCEDSNLLGCPGGS